MAVRNADSTLLDRAISLREDLRVLEADLRRYGDRELADVAKRAYREFQLPVFQAPARRAGKVA